MSRFFGHLKWQIRNWRVMGSRIAPLYIGVHILVGVVGLVTMPIWVPLLMVYFVGHALLDLLDL